MKDIPLANIIIWSCIVGLILSIGMMNYILLSPSAEIAETQDIVSITVYTSTSCHWCDKFKEEVLDHPNVKKALQGIKVSIIDMHDPSCKELVRAVPEVYFYKNGKKVCYFVGYKDKDEFLKYLWQAINA